MGRNWRIAALLLMAPASATGVRLSGEAIGAFDRYTKEVEARLGREARRQSAADGELQAAGVRIEAVNGGCRQVSGGLLHHWRAAALVPGAKAADMLALLRDYDHLADSYAPEVVSSRMLTGSGEAARIEMRFRKQRVITVVLDAEFEVRSALTGAGRGYSISRSRHIWQVDQAGSEGERRRVEGDDDGYLWRLNSYWSFEETPQGLLIECEAVSLTRDVPARLGWLINPIVQGLPRDSLEFTLRATRNALAAKGRKEAER